MKRASFLLLAITLTLVAACQPDENQNKNKNANANANASANVKRNQSLLAPMPPTDKMVQIFIHDDKTAGNYEVEDPGSTTLHTKMGQRIQWCVVYDGKTPPDEVVLDNFRTETGLSAANPFGSGSAGDNAFSVAKADFNDCKMPAQTPMTGATPATYKYMITVKVGGVDKGHLDPRVIINE